MTDIGDILELAMSNRLFDVVDVLLQLCSKKLMEEESFLERFKAYTLAKWMLNDEWNTDEPDLILSIISDNLSLPDDVDLVLNGALKILAAKCTQDLGMDAFIKLVDSVFPEELWDTEKQKILDACRKAKSPEKVIIDLCHISTEALKNQIFNLIGRIEKDLPVVEFRRSVSRGLNVSGSVQHNQSLQDSYDDFSVADLRRVFGGSLDAWSQIVRQEDKEVIEFLEKRKRRTQKKPRQSAASPAIVVDSTVLKPVSTPTLLLSPVGRKYTSPKPVEPKSASEEGGSAVRRRFFSKEEEKDLVRGVRKYGKGSWKAILTDEAFHFNNRSTQDLKDKWRNMAKKLEAFEREVDEDDQQHVQARGSKKVSVKREAEDVVDPVREAALERRNKRLQADEENM